MTRNISTGATAACAGTPVINVFFDGNKPVNPALSVQRFRYYTHYAKLLETDGISQAHSTDDFIAMANAYVQDPSLHHEGREEMIRQQIGSLDGNAGQRTAEAIWDLARTGSVQSRPDVPSPRQAVC